MKATKEKTVSVRLLPADFAKLENQAHQQSSHRGSLCAQVITHYLRLKEHPAISFQTLPDGGFVARLAGRRIAVWIVLETIKDTGSLKAAAEYLSVPVALVVAARAYAAEYPDEMAADAARGKAPVRDEA